MEIAEDVRRSELLMANFHNVTTEDDEYIWSLFVLHEGEEFYTSRGLPFTYRRKIGRNGEALGELVVDRKEKTITRNTIVLAYSHVRELMESEGCVAGSKKLNCFGASYIYPVFIKLGICRGK
mgnify:CR=1 FL=1